MNVRVCPDADGRYSRTKLRTALGEICHAAGLDPTGARLIRFVNNAVFQLLAHPVVVRIVLSPSLRYRADNVVRAARWLAEHDVPAVRLLPGLSQPLQVKGHVATLWQAVPETGQATGMELAQLLKRLHALQEPPGHLLRWDPLADVRRRLADAEELDAGDREFLENRCEELAEQLARLDYHLPPGVIHGDAHVGNVISTPVGPLLCDLDSVCAGPREWDLTPLAVGKLRFRHTGDRYRQLSRAYGFDVTKWPGFPVLRQVRELKLTTGVLSILRSNPDVRPELAKRMHSFRSGDTRTRWTPHR
ncbi:aminoglycoside phosphotransferase (APT) family kinase protein [Crossiella equi]|uniref:Aminoglycoside phosphotransferase (APT) family kinase protein n=1 Tax=Crossiella equi TaxID=130796 RepID=A0ABS5AFX3_9PSEU|nr:aminoglycoside phosphotransferase family protein [Crossiella equi]MBP2475488.1 aminoglycoside phosphotransferase (APT) family kinase protein [Crossiella equi]